MSKQLLAKSRHPIYGDLLLSQHLTDTEQAGSAIFRDRILKNWCRFFRIKDESNFLKHLRIANLFHDIGKANSEFDARIRGKNLKQCLRHEWLSALILHLPNVRDWLRQSDLDLEIITASVLCHHLQASESKKNGIDAFGKQRTPVNEIQLYLDDPQVQNILTKIGEIAGIEGIPELPKKWELNSQWRKAYEDACDTAEDFEDDIEDDPKRRALLLAVKAGVIASDSVASGIFRTKGSEEIAAWVNTYLHQNPITPEEIEQDILQPRYQDIERKSNMLFHLKPFQKKAIEQSLRLLLLSACGTGKTIFAYKWQQGVLREYQAGRIIFLYPTRGTATEGFKDYVSWAPESKASLLHGTALYDLKELWKNPSESTQNKDFTANERLYALGFWEKRFFSATVDQFLSFLTHSYSGICLLPILADSVVVIDEIHSFSKKMFDNLISFLEHFDIPVLCMTATLPKARREELTAKLENRKPGAELDVFPKEQERSQLKTLKDAEERSRYLIHSTNQETAFSNAIEAYQQGKRVLWVVNTVDRCRDIANQLENEVQNEVLTYHSRFRLDDRQNRHSATVSAFQGEGTAIIAVTTQVCEMSLDLDADVLITELAPISSLVQRFGRSNRHGLIDYASIWVYEPPQVLPYNKKELAQAKTFLEDLPNHQASQKDLAEKLEEHSLWERLADGSSSFINGGYWATPESFRDIDDYSVSAILDADINDFLQLHQENNSKAEGYILPIPKRFTLSPEECPEQAKNLPPYLAVADHQKYSEQRGFGE